MSKTLYRFSIRGLVLSLDSFLRNFINQSKTAKLKKIINLKPPKIIFSTSHVISHYRAMVPSPGLTYEVYVVGGT